MAWDTATQQPIVKTYRLGNISEFRVRRRGATRLVPIAGGGRPLPRRRPAFRIQEAEGRFGR